MLIQTCRNIADYCWRLGQGGSFGSVLGWSMLLIFYGLPEVVAQSGQSADFKTDKGDMTSAPAIRESLRLNEPYCGLLCVYMAANHYRIKSQAPEMPLSDILRGEYLPGRYAPAFPGICEAAQKVGMQATSLKNVTRSFLEQASVCVILKVKPNLYEPDFSHYVLFTGSAGGFAKVYDPYHSYAELPWEILLSRMNGDGLLLASKGNSGPGFMAFAGNYILAFIGALLVIWGLRKYFGVAAKTQKKSSLIYAYCRTAVCQASIIVLVSIGAMLLRHSLSASGILHSPAIVASLREEYSANYLPKIKRARVAELLKKDALVIDCRARETFEKDHIPGAISLPVYMSSDEIESSMSRTARDKKLVVYCQNKGCRFAQIVGRRLAAIGFKDIEYFEGGWMEWMGAK